MKFIHLSIFSLSPMLLPAQKVFTVDHASQADAILYEVAHRSQADILIYKVPYRSQADAA